MTHVSGLDFFMCVFLLAFVVFCFVLCHSCHSSTNAVIWVVAVVFLDYYWCRCQLALSDALFTCLYLSHYCITFHFIWQSSECEHEKRRKDPLWVVIAFFLCPTLHGFPLNFESVSFKCTTSMFNFCLLLRVRSTL